MPIKAMITEDDLLSTAMLCDLIEDYFPEVIIIRKAQTVKDSVAFLNGHKIDLLFLDIELPDGNGFDILRSLEVVNFKVVITTSHPNYMEANPSQKILASIVKPVTLSTLQQAMNMFIQKSHEIGHMLRVHIDDK